MDGLYDDKIPSERELIDRFSVSRTTIREAINNLVHEGMLKKVHGKGTFVQKTKPVHDWIQTIKSLTDTINRMGMKPGSQLIESKLVQEPDHIADYLNTEEFHLIQRLRTADDEPIAIEYHYHHPDLGKQLAEFDLNDITIYDILENNLGINMSEAEQSITCKQIRMNDADYLEIPPYTNVLAVDRVIRNQLGEIVEYYSSYIRPEQYVFRFTLSK